ncbi:hypothetical protein [Rhodanobacter sp. B05]|uniref:hypothetical protein n=1 Tax=Rhodanobacter sp. B05 TaxID=1945859 RepID=UPI0011154D92|nr:hypothetical protein [Rhodanobacter sp. B05]
MSNSNLTVVLNVCNFHNSDGYWTNISAANGSPYSYQYSGGNDHDQDSPQGHIPHGHVKHAVGHGAATIEVQLRCDPRYVFDQVSFDGNDQGQLAWQRQGTDPKSRTITNQCTHATTTHYKIKIRDTTANTTLDCDPVIRNVPV